MNINSKFFSIPPYLSTSWKEISSLHVENHHSAIVLIVTLVTEMRIEIPHLEGSTIEAAFTAHAKYLEESSQVSTKSAKNGPISEIIAIELPFKLPFNLENFGSLLQHNAEQANMPPLPPELLKKISSLSKMLGIEDPHAFPKPEPHCNCTHCQIARSLQEGLSQDALEEIVSDEDLTFRSWDIQPSGEQLFVVTDPIDEKEHYTVFLGDPIGCTCGEKHCEHIRAVLQS